MKNNAIYCFTGTGNSLFIAKQIAKATGSKVEIIRKSLFDKEMHREYHQLGIVFPVYHQGLPVMVVKFLKMLKDVEIDYIYGVSTYGERPTLALNYMKDILKVQNHNLDIGFAIRMPYNYLRPRKIGKGMYASFSVKVPNETKRAMEYKEAENRLKVITDAINRKISGDIEVSDRLIENFVDRLNLRDSLQKRQWLKIAGYKGEIPDTFPQAIALMDTNFTVSQKCSSCGICGLVCPAQNITYKDNKPVWNHCCEQCMACLHWCSQGAINWGLNSCNGMQYHHPQITLKDILYGGEEK